jgi:peptidoglycan/LPS O-acetylase OafA/YrhL
MNRTNRPGVRLPLVEYLRGLASLSVAWFHLTNQYEMDWVRMSGALGYLGVAVFFVISGFIIPLSLASSGEQYSIILFPRFFSRRVIRLEPPYIASVLLAILLWNLSMLVPGFKGQPPSNDIGQFLAHVGYFVPLTKYGWIQPVYWTLAYEFIFYIAMGLLFPLVMGTNTNGRWYLLAGALGALVFSGLLPVYTMLFVMGIALYRAAGKEQVRSKAEFAITLAASAISIAQTNPDIAITGATTAVAILAWKDRALPSLLSRILLGLGAISYSLYLTHVLIGGRIVNMGRRFVNTSAEEVLLSVAALVMSLLFAWLFWRIVEAPSIRASRTA